MFTYLSIKLINRKPSEKNNLLTIDWFEIPMFVA